VKNAYGSSEFPGIAVNGRVNDDVELEIVQDPSNVQDVYPQQNSGAADNSTNHIQVSIMTEAMEQDH
jgi:hypothetical protein